MQVPTHSKLYVEAAVLFISGLNAIVARRSSTSNISTFHRPPIVTVKGFAGEDLPRVLIPSHVAREVDQSGSEEQIPPVRYKNPPRAGFSALSTRKDNVDISSPFNNDGLVQNWDSFEAILSHTLINELRVDSRQYALLFTDPNHNGRKPHERITELVFEKFEAPALYLARSAVLSALANGRTTGIVLDVGYSGTSAVPVEDGSIVKNGIIRTATGGRHMNSVLSAVLEKHNIQLRPTWSYKRTITGTHNVDDDNVVRRSAIEELSFPKTRSSFTEFARTGLLEEIKAGICMVNENPTVDLKSLPVLTDTFELPDGNTIELGAERFDIAEKTVFGQLEHIASEASTEVRRSYVNQYLNGGQQGDGERQRVSNGLHGLVVDAIKMCDTSIQRDMYAGVCLTGGMSDMSGLFERLSYGLMEWYHKVRILAAPGSLERKYCAWTGGSILATFTEHQKSWFSRGEYEENGSSFIHRKCQ